MKMRLTCWMTSNNCYDYAQFYEWYCEQKSGNWASGNLEEGQAAKHKGELPFPKPETRLPRAVVGYAECGCGAGFEPGVVMDIFGGSGTTTVVARKNSRSSVSFDLKGEYCEMAMKRIEPHMNQRKITEEYGDG